MRLLIRKTATAAAGQSASFPTRLKATGRLAPRRHGGAARDVEVIAPGGTQRVEWREDAIYQTGWAELVLEGTAFL